MEIYVEKLLCTCRDFSNFILFAFAFALLFTSTSLCFGFAFVLLFAWLLGFVKVTLIKIQKIL